MGLIRTQVIAMQIRKTPEEPGRLERADHCSRVQAHVGSLVYRMLLLTDFLNTKYMNLKRLSVCLSCLKAVKERQCLNICKTGFWHACPATRTYRRDYGPRTTSQAKKECRTEVVLQTMILERVGTTCRFATAL